MTTRTFTAEELAKYNGQNGQPAYVAIDGTVYDVSAAIRRSLHMKKVLDDLPVVGKFTGDPEV